MGCAPEAVDRDPQMQPPGGVLGRDEFVRVLTEIQMVEAVSDLRTYRNDNEKQRLAEAYNDVWRTGVSAETFEASWWWWAQPAAMAMLRDVVDALKEMVDAKRRRSGLSQTQQPQASRSRRYACTVETMTSGMGV